MDFLTGYRTYIAAAGLCVTALFTAVHLLTGMDVGSIVPADATWQTVIMEITNALGLFGMRAAIAAK